MIKKQEVIPPHNHGDLAIVTPPLVHHGQHEIGGNDAITPAAIGAADTHHHDTHDTGGDDLITALAGEVLTSGTIDGDRLPAISTTKKGAVPAVTPSGKFFHDSNAFLELITLGIAPVTPYAAQIWCDPNIQNPGVIIPDVVIPGSGIDVYAVAALHFNGDNLSTSFIDSSLTPKIFTSHGGAVISTTSPKFGTGAGYGDGTNGYVDTPAHADFGFGTGNFTIDFWMKATGHTDFANLMGCSDSSFSTNIDQSWIVRQGANGDLGFFYFNGVDRSYIIIGTEAMTATGAWVHCAVVRNGISLKSYVAGILYAEVILSPGFSFATSTKKFSLFRPGEYNDLYYTQRLDELRISKGIARWTADFTPPVAEYA